MEVIYSNDSFLWKVQSAVYNVYMKYLNVKHKYT